MSDYVVHRTKLVAYLLNPDHPKGGPKCRPFVRFGFAVDRPDELAQALIAHADSSRDLSHIVSDAMVRRIVKGPLLTPIGRSPNAVSVWELLADGRERLITAYFRET